jgi:hypothetical protein
MAEKYAVTLDANEVQAMERILMDADGAEALEFLERSIRAKLAEGRRVREEHGRLRDRNVKG